MNKIRLKQLIFMAICCDIGLFCKKFVSPVTNIITEALHIPGGIATGFSIMFIIIAKVTCDTFGSATLMCIIQSGVALSIGMVGSMGFLAPIGYIVPGIAIDIVFLISKKFDIPIEIKLPISNALASVMAALTANTIVFHLRGPVLGLYASVAAFSGVIFGSVAILVASRLAVALKIEANQK